MESPLTDFVSVFHFVTPFADDPVSCSLLFWLDESLLTCDYVKVNYSGGE
jgi:hypothetical protein